MAYESLYPWDRWTNGQYWKVTQTADFTCFGLSLAGALYSHAVKVSMAVTASVFEYDYDDDVVIFHFYDADSLWKPNLKALPAWRQEKERHTRRQRKPV